MSEATSDTRSPMVARPVPRRRVRHGRMGLFDWAVFAAFVILAGSLRHWESEGPLVLIGLTLLFGAYVAHGALSHGVLLSNGLLFAWSLWGVLHIGLSYARWLPGEPMAFYSDYILRTGYFTLLIYPATAAFYLLFVRAHAAGRLPLLARLGIGAAITAALVNYFFPVYDGIWRIEGQGGEFFKTVLGSLNYGISNMAILFWWSLLLLARWRALWMIAIIAVMAFSLSAQMLILAALTAGLWLWPRAERLGAPLSAAIMIGFPLAAFLLVTFAGNTNIDPNTIGRARWWSEALLAVWENYGFGLGFGADSITDFRLTSRFLMEGKFAVLPIKILHNSLIYVFYATGVIGGVLFLLFHFKSLIPRRQDDRDMSRLMVLMLLMAGLTVSVNAALESPNFILGLCWIYGYLLAMNRCQIKRTHHA